MLNFSIFLFILSLINHGDAVTVHRCLGTNFTTNSTFQWSLNLVLSSLSSNAPGANGFFNTSAGRTPVDTVYGLFQCRGDATNASCRNCVMEATINTACPFRKGAVVWYEDCMLRYSDHFFFSFVSTEPSYYLKHPTSMAVDTARFDPLVMSTLTTAAAKAASNETMYFGTEEATFTSNTTVYTLAQCTADLSNSDCEDCLTKAMRGIPGCCSNKIGGRVLFPSCHVRYEIYPFYRINMTDLAMPPVTLQPTFIIPSGKRRLSSGVVVAVIAAPITFSLLVFVVVVCYQSRRGNRKKDTDICSLNIYIVT